MMELDMDEKMLKCYMNNVDQGIAFDNIPFRNDQTYTMCVSFDELMPVKLINSQQTH